MLAEKRTLSVSKFINFEKMTDQTTSTPIECPKCSAPMREALVKSTIWIGEHLHIVEDIPAQFCDECMEQFYDEDVTDAVRRLTELGFPAEEAKSQMTVPVFSITGRIKRRRPATEEELLADY